MMKRVAQTPVSEGCEPNHAADTVVELRNGIEPCVLCAVQKNMKCHGTPASVPPENTDG